jgi:SHS2 domain-containing protein
MGRIECFDHTADLGLRIHATDLDDLYRTVAEALFDVMVVNRQAVRARDRECVSLLADSPESLLISWLNELIYRSETAHRFFSKFDVRVSPEGSRLEAEIFGEPVDLDRHLVDHEVKAVTHHGLRLIHEEGGWLAEVILDI